MAHDGDAFGDATANALAAKLLGIKTAGFGRNRGIVALIAYANEPRAQVIHLLLILAVYESKTTRDDWRTPNPRTQRYLLPLAAIGYALSPIETRATGATPKPDETPDTDPEHPDTPAGTQPDSATE